METQQQQPVNKSKKYMKRSVIAALSLLTIFKGPACYQHIKNINNIKSGRLEYTERGGRIDRGHADPGGVRHLRNRVNSPQDIPGDSLYGLISYGQHQRIHGYKFGVDKQYRVLKNMTEQEKLSVSLAILLEVSYEFEEYQSGTDYVTGSSYNEADVFSNVLGLYIASGQCDKDEIRSLLVPVGVDSSLIMYHQRKIGKNKIKERVIQITKDGDMMVSPYPYPFDNIQPAEKGILFKEYE